MPRIRYRSLATALALLTVGTGCRDGGRPAERGVVDDAGRVHDRGEPLDRIVSLVPGMTETLVALGAADRLVARTRYDEQPELAALPSVGGGLDPSLEFLVDLDPQLVVTWRDAGGAGALSDRLEGLGLSPYEVNIQHLDDFRRHARNLGRLVGRPEAADSLVAGVNANLARVARSVAGRRRPEVLFLAQRDPPMGAGAGTFVDSIIVGAGGQNVLHDGPEGWPMVSMEEIIWRAPDHLVVPAVGYGTPTPEEDSVPAAVRTFLRGPGWTQVTAAAEGRVIVVDAGLFGRPGPGMPDAARFLASRLHPGALSGATDTVP